MIQFDNCAYFFQMAGFFGSLDRYLSIVYWIWPDSPTKVRHFLGVASWHGPMAVSESCEKKWSFFWLGVHMLVFIYWILIAYKYQIVYIFARIFAYICIHKQIWGTNFSFQVIEHDRKHLRLIRAIPPIDTVPLILQLLTVKKTYIKQRVSFHRY